MTRFRTRLLGAMIAMIAMSGGRAYGQADPNSLPNPYLTIDHWAKMPEGRTWGQTSQLSLDRDGNVWVAERCGGTSCLGKTDAPILEFDHSGKLVKSFGAGMLVVPHGILVDRDGNIWVTDSQGGDGKGQQVFKFSPDGKVLMTLGKAGVAGDGPDTFNRPSAVAIASNGDIFVGDGPWRGFERANREIFEGWEVHQNLGKEGVRSGRVLNAPLTGLRFQRAVVCGRPRKSPHPNIQSGWGISRPMETIRNGQRNFYRQERRHVCGR